MVFLAYNSMFDKNSQKKITHFTFDSVLVDWQRLWIVRMCDSIKQAGWTETSKEDPFEAVQILRFGFNQENPDELYLCERKKNSCKY